MSKIASLLRRLGEDDDSSSDDDDNPQMGQQIVNMRRNVDGDDSEKFDLLLAKYLNSFDPNQTDTLQNDINTLDGDTQQQLFDDAKKFKYVDGFDVNEDASTPDLEDKSDDQLRSLYAELKSKVDPSDSSAEGQAIQDFFKDVQCAMQGRGIDENLSMSTNVLSMIEATLPQIGKGKLKIDVEDLKAGTQVEYFFYNGTIKVSAISAKPKYIKVPDGIAFDQVIGQKLSIDSDHSLDSLDKQTQG